MLKIKVDIYKYSIIMIIIFIPINLFKDLFAFPIMPIMGGGILALLFIVLMRHLTKGVFYALLIPVGVFLINFAVTDSLTRHIRYFFNWYSLLCILLICGDIKLLERFKKAYIEYSKEINKLVWMVALIILILLAIPQAYSSGWWGLSNGFTAFTVSHAVAASACALATFVLNNTILNKNIKASLILLFVCVFAIFQTGARAYVISIGALFLLYIFYIIKNRKLKAVIIVCSIIFIIIIWSNSTFSEKQSIVLSYQTVHKASLLEAITSGRTVIWMTDISHFLKSDVFTYIFGRGSAYSYYLNRNYYYMDIFSHNIFLETLLSLGLIGLFILVREIIKPFKSNNLKGMGFISLFIYVVVVGFINGLFDSQIYCFSILIVCIAYRILHDKRTEIITE